MAPFCAICGVLERRHPGTSHEFVPLKSFLEQEILDALVTLRQEVGSDNLIDIGSSSDSFLNVNGTKKTETINLLKVEGYKVWYIPVGDPPKNLKVLASPGTTFEEVMKHKSEIRQLTKNNKENV